MHCTMILFYSDYLEGCHPDILKRFGETNLVQTPGYSEDEYCEAARQTIKNACSAPDADVHFLVGGTQTNATVISSILKPYQGALCASSGHINVHETGAIEHSGHKVLAIPSEDGKVSAAQVEDALKVHYSESSPEHMVQPGMLYISFPTELGTIYTRKELEAIRKVCNDWEIPLYIDGARLGYGLESSGCDLLLKDIASLADVFYIGGTKQGALFGEAVVIRKESLKADFRYNIKQNGGMLAKGRLLGIQFSVLFSEGLYFRLSRNADRLADRIRDAFREKGCRFLVENRTNQIFPVISREYADRLSDNFGFEFWENVDDDHIAVRFCTSWATTDSNVDALIEAVRSL